MCWIACRECLGLAEALRESSHYHLASYVNKKRMQDVIGRGSKVHPLYARIVEARAARAVVIPAQPAKGLQVPLTC